MCSRRTPPKALPKSAESFQLGGDAADKLTPVDYSDVCVNVDDAWFAAEKIPPPKTLEDLTEPAYKDLFVTPGATTSSPGLAFLLATISAEGDGWQEYWKKLMANGAKVTSGWTDAYEVDFTAGGGKGARPIVTSYSSSPPFTIAEGKTRPPTRALLDTCFRQVEYAGVLKGSENPKGMQKFIDFMLERKFQAAIPDNMYVYPVDRSVPLPKTWTKYAPVAPDPLTVDPDEVSREPRRVAARVARHHQPVSFLRARAPSRYRLGTLALAAVPLVALTVFFLYPVAGMLARGFWPEGSFDPGAVLEVLGRPRVRRVLWFTLWSAASATLISVVAGVPVAFALHRLRFPGRDLLRALVVVPFVLPTVVVGVAFRQLIAPSGWLGGLGLDGTAAAIVAALVFFNISVVVRTVGSFWEAIDPRREEAAAALGASPWQVWRTVTLPALRPGIVSAATVVFLFCATAFGVVLTMGGLRYANVETEIYLLTTQELDLTARRGVVGPAAAGDRRAARPLCPGTPLRCTGRPQHPSRPPAAPCAPRRTQLDSRGRGLPDGTARLAGGRLVAARGQLGAAELPRAEHHRRPQRAARAGHRRTGQLADVRAGREPAGSASGVDRGVPRLAAGRRPADRPCSTGCSCCRSGSRR